MEIETRRRVCSKCDSEYDDYGQRSSMCRPCKRIYDRDYHKNRSVENLQRKSELQRKRKNAIRDSVREWKGSIGCKFCDEKEPICLDLHHVDPNNKDIDVADATRQGWTFERIMVEAEKCVVVCSNCHRKIHAGLIQCGEL